MEATSQSKQKKTKFIFDCADSFSARCEIMTPNRLKFLMSDPKLIETCEQIAGIAKAWKPGMTKAEKRDFKDKISPLKKKLKGIIWQAHFPNGCRSVDKEPNYELSGLCVVDFDEIDDPRQVWEEKIQPHIERLIILCAFVSPSLHGLKVVFRKPDNLSIEEAQRWFCAQVGMSDYLDTSGKDPARFCFMVPESYLLYCNQEALFAEHVDPETYCVEADEMPSEEEIKRIDPALRQIMLKSGESAPATPTDAARIEARVDAGYHNIPYANIIDRYWELYNDGKTPEYGDRNTKIYELAVVMRHIAGFDLNLLDAIIPNYDGFDEAEKLQCLKSALSKEHYQTPLKLKAVLDSFKVEYADHPDVINALEDTAQQAESLPFQKIKQIFKSHKKHLPLGISDSMDGVRPGLYMPVLIGIGPMIGALATGVVLRVHDDFKHLNLLAYIVGEAASGKSTLDSLYQNWMSGLLAQDRVNAEVLEKWKAKSAKDREKSKRPKVLIRVQPLRTSMADVLNHLETANGDHLYSYSAEADQLSQTRRSGSYANVGVIIRLSFDGAEFKSSYAGECAVNADIPHVHWNITLCTTPDGLFRATPNVTDGEVTRWAIARTPDSTFAPLTRIKPRKQSSVENINRVASLLMLMEGQVELSKLQARCERWLEAIRLDALKNDDRVRANMRKRSAVIAMRYTCCFMLCAYAEWLLRKLDNRGTTNLPDWADGSKTAEEYLTEHPDALSKQLKNFQTVEYLEMFDVIADYVLDNQLFYFHDRIQQACDAPSYITSQRVHEGTNDSVFDRLPQEFGIEDAHQAKGVGASDNAVKQMVKNWRKSGLIEPVERGRYRKLNQ